MKEIRVAILGNVDSAKSTLVSTITYNVLDNGRGSAREKVFKHKHEKKLVEHQVFHFGMLKLMIKNILHF